MASPEAVVQKCSVKKLVLKLRPATLLKRDPPQAFSCEFLRTPILKNICERLLLHLKYGTPTNNTTEPVAEYS